MDGTTGLFLWSVVGGLAGTGSMDIADTVAERLGITSRGS
jgi:hypothetical protein